MEMMARLWLLEYPYALHAMLQGSLFFAAYMVSAYATLWWLNRRK